jgi:hypothetical protein
VRGVERDNKESGPKGPGLGLPKGAAQSLRHRACVASSRQPRDKLGIGRQRAAKKIKVSMFL